MKKNFRALLCVTALIGAMSAGTAFAADLDIASGDSYQVTTAESYDNITNLGEIENSSTLSAINNFTNNATVTNTGDITISNSSDNATLTNTSTINNNGSLVADVITNETNGKIQGTGSLSVKGGENAGDITLNDVTISGNFTNTGTIKANNNFANSSTLQGAGSLDIKDGSNTGNISQSDITISGSFVNNGIMQATNELVLGNGLENNKTVIAKILSNEGDITGANGSLTIEGGSNTGNITQKDFTLSNGDFVNAPATSGQGGNITITGNFKNTGNITGNASGEKGTLTVANGSNSGSIDQKDFTVTQNTSGFTNSGTISADESIQNSGKLNNSGEMTTYGTLTNNGVLTNERNGKVNIIGTTNSTLENTNTIINRGTFDFTPIGGGNNILNNSGVFSNDGGAIIGAIVNNTNTLTATNGAHLSLEDLVNDNGTLNILNGSTVDIANLTNALKGTLNVEGKGQNTPNKLVFNGNNNFEGTLNIGNNSGTNSDLDINNVIITDNATVNIKSGGKLSVSNNSVLNLNEGDNVAGDIHLYEDAGTGDAGTINLTNFTLVTGSSSTQAGGDKAYYSQDGGILNLNNSTLSLGDSSAMRGGEMNIDGTSQFLVTSEANGTYDNFLDKMTIQDGGRFGVMNGGVADYNIDNLNINGTTDFTIDVYARSNREDQHATDQFIGTDLLGNGTINIEDWSLGGDIFGWDAPIDRVVEFPALFDYNNIDPTIKLTATKKETFTPIGWYQLNQKGGGVTGGYTLNLTRFNPQVFRGQVTTIAQYMNQLAIDDMLFNHSMLLPSFKEEDGGTAYSGMMANRYAAANPLYAPYQYSRKDGGLWCKMYGTFENLHINQTGLNRVGNNAYGALIGADFGLKELRNGWKFMPTAYIGYNGAHQYWSGMGAYQNGGQAGFLGTWYKNNFIIGGLVYGGVYDNSMDVAGKVDSTFNYFAGASVKTAYNWRFHRDWVLQPNLMVAYNFFGQQNWHSEFGQMGMMSGLLNGINIAPGLNLIWEKETFSIYGTLQYMYNVNGAVGGRAGNVYLPNVEMERGYIQYGLGFTKRFSDRFSGYFQTVFRNVGRTGVGFQLGFNWMIGK